MIACLDVASVCWFNVLEFLGWAVLIVLPLGVAAWAFEGFKPFRRGRQNPSR